MHPKITLLFPINPHLLKDRRKVETSNFAKCNCHQSSGTHVPVTPKGGVKPVSQTMAQVKKVLSNLVLRRRSQVWWHMTASNTSNSEAKVGESVLQEGILHYIASLRLA